MSSHALVPEETTLGFIGLGVMGFPMATNLASAGYKLRVYDRSRDACQSLAAKGVTVCESPADVAREAEATITMLPNSAAVEEVFIGDDGLREGAGAGHIALDMSTVAPETIRVLSGILGEQDVHVVDAPVSGGQGGARSGTLSIMVGGTPEAVRRVEPILGVLGASNTHIGPTGAGQVAKACNQVALAVTIHGVAEALTLARQSGVDVRRVREAMLGGSAASHVLEVKGQKMIERDLTAGFRVALQDKDLQLALNEAQRCGVVLPLASAAKQSLVSLMAHGHGDLDNSSLLLHIELLSAVDPAK